MCSSQIANAASSAPGAWIDLPPRETTGVALAKIHAISGGGSVAPSRRDDASLSTDPSDYTVTRVRSQVQAHPTHGCVGADLVLAGCR